MANASHQLARHSFSMETDEWERFATAVKATSPELTRSMAMRELIRWWMDPTEVRLRIGYPPIWEKEQAL
jgi:hypothetical protein